MKGTITINDKNYEAVANAASPYLYRKIFNEDFILAFNPEKPQPALFEKMFFVMVKQAELPFKEVMNLGTDDFYEFLSDFDPLDIISEIDKISDLYFKNTKGTSSPKEKAG